MNLLEMLMGSMTSDDSVAAVAKRSGGENKQISKMLTAAVPILLGALTKNASSEEGASSLMSALGQHTSKNPIASQIADADEEDGNKILQHIFGGQTQQVASQLSQESGMDGGQVMKALASVAPALLSGISAATTSAGNQKKAGVDLSDGLDMSDVMALMGGGASGSSGGGLLGSLMGGGSGGGILGGLFGGSQKSSELDGSDLLGALTKLMK